MSDTLTIGTANALADILRACQGNLRVRWAVHGDVAVITSGTARAITTHDGALWGDGDVRDAYVWISGTFETFMPVREVLALMADSLFVVAA